MAKEIKAPHKKQEQLEYQLEAFLDLRVSLQEKQKNYSLGKT